MPGESSNSSMVDSNLQVLLCNRLAPLRSNSSMVDSNQYKVPFCLCLRPVQIPLWSIVTPTMSLAAVVGDEFKFLYGR